MGPTWVLSAPDGPHFGPMNLAIRDSYVLASCPTPSPINVLERNRWAIPATSYKWYHIRFHQSICCFLYSLLKLHHKEDIKAAQNWSFQHPLYKKKICVWLSKILHLQNLIYNFKEFSKKNYLPNWSSFFLQTISSRICQSLCLFGKHFF